MVFPRTRVNIITTSTSPRTDGGRAARSLSLGRGCSLSAKYSAPQRKTKLFQTSLCHQASPTPKTAATRASRGSAEVKVGLGSLHWLPSPGPGPPVSRDARLPPPPDAHALALPWPPAAAAAGVAGENAGTVAALQAASLRCRERTPNTRGEGGQIFLSLHTRPWPCWLLLQPRPAAWRGRPSQCPDAQGDGRAPPAASPRASGCAAYGAHFSSGRRASIWVGGHWRAVVLRPRQQPPGSVGATWLHVSHAGKTQVPRKHPTHRPHDTQLWSLKQDGHGGNQAAQGLSGCSRSGLSK